MLFLYYFVTLQENKKYINYLIITQEHPKQI